MKPKERISNGDDMTKYEEMAQIKRAVSKQLKYRKQPKNMVSYTFPHVDSVKKSVLPSYITDNPFYP